VRNAPAFTQSIQDYRLFASDAFLYPRHNPRDAQNAAEHPKPETAIVSLRIAVHNGLAARPVARQVSHNPCLNHPSGSVTLQSSFVQISLANITVLARR